ncbi:hypothetical protein GCM10022225_30150 [Plantactinospora mayteni]|uniref:Transposase n=1 Tax=Plantactinospora mayteni TaxID=566021 RepID=A0ABQ4EVJ6_9ACTN|nr:hypothetical protein Pma05_52240 [Plantactinospora mayteni]
MVATCVGARARRGGKDRIAYPAEKIMDVFARDAKTVDNQGRPADPARPIRRSTPPDQGPGPARGYPVRSSGYQRSSTVLPSGSDM